MIAIIDYGAGNLRSVEKAFVKLGADVVVTKDKNVIEKADKVVLPGVGSFGAAMDKIHESGLYDVIHKTVIAGKPFLGICLGLQLMFEESEESPGAKGLGILKGSIVKIPQVDSIKIPQIGWNKIDYDKHNPLFDGIGEDAYIYLVHSYYAKPEDASLISATCEYGSTLSVAIRKDNVFLTQFHPEKSGDIGLKMLDNFAKM